MPKRRKSSGGKKRVQALNVLKPELFSSSFGSGWASSSSFSYDYNEDSEPDLDTSRSSISMFPDSDGGDTECDLPPDMCESSSSELENSGQGRRGSSSGRHGDANRKRISTVRFASEVNLRRKWIRDTLLEVQQRTQPKHRTLSAPPSILRRPKPKAPLTVPELEELLSDSHLQLLEEENDLCLAQKERECVENAIRDLKKELHDYEINTRLDASDSSAALSALLHRPRLNLTALGTSITDLQQAIWWLEKEEIPKFDRATKSLEESCSELLLECEWLQKARQRRQQLMLSPTDVFSVIVKPPSCCKQEKPERVRVPLPPASFAQLDSSIHSLAA